MHLFRKAGGAIGPVLRDLLRAIVGRLAVAKLPSYIQVGCVDGFQMQMPHRLSRSPTRGNLAGALSHVCAAR
jgi:hypothetical protein